MNLRKEENYYFRCIRLWVLLSPRVTVFLSAALRNQLCSDCFLRIHCGPDSDSSPPIDLQTGMGSSQSGWFIGAKEEQLLNFIEMRKVPLKKCLLSSSFVRVLMVRVRRIVDILSFNPQKTAISINSTLTLVGIFKEVFLCSLRA